MQAVTIEQEQRSPLALFRMIPPLNRIQSLRTSKLLLSTAALFAMATPAVPADAPPAHLDALAIAQLNPDAQPIGLDRGAPGLARALAALGTRASMLMIVAHPDDEDGGMLTLQSRLLGARTAVLTLTRGEGGQNAMSTDFYDALGLVRTEELLAADRYYGVNQFWGTVIDYGFSKTREEALDKWGYDRTLSDAVRIVRQLRPLVITAVFAGAPTDGHGNHQVSGQIAQEVFEAAGDPNHFPEQIRAGLRPWKPAKVYGRVPFFAPTKQNTIYDSATDKYVPVRFYDYVARRWIEHTPSTDFGVAEGSLLPAAGLGFSQIARQGWGFQKSQNGGATLPLPSFYTTPYHRYGSRVSSPTPEKSFYDGLDVSFSGLIQLSTGGDDAFLKQGLQALSAIVEQVSHDYRPQQPEALAQLLARGLSLNRNLLASVNASSLAEPGKSDIAFELEKKNAQFENALALSLGISLHAAVAPEKEARGPFAATPTTFTNAIPGQTFPVQISVINQGAQPVHLNGCALSSAVSGEWHIHGDLANAADLAAGSETKRRATVTVPPDAPSTRPYFIRPDQEQPYYNLIDERFRNLSTSPYPLAASARVSFGGVSWTLSAILQTNSRTEGIGIEQNPLLIAPAVSVATARAAGALPLRAKAFPFSCTVQNNVKGAAEGSVQLQLPPGWRSAPAERNFAFTRDGEMETFRFQITPGTLKPDRYEIRAAAQYRGKTYTEGYRLVGYRGLRPYPYYRSATYRATGVDVRTAPGLHVGFIPGSGDDVSDALGDLGVQSATLNPAALEPADLASYDAVILGVRAYSSRPEVRAANARLLNYVKNGGVLIVQYNLQNLDEGYGPYSFSLGSNPQKVVEENSAVRFLDPSNPALSWPNRITPADFDGWEEERGHGFMEKWDAHYKPLVETHDADQPPQRGGLLIARYGKGFYVYDALALYRQLPAGVPGAYRILANLVSLGKAPGERNQSAAKNESTGGNQ